MDHPSQLATDMVWLHCPAVPKGKSAKLHRYWQGQYKVLSLLGITSPCTILAVIVTQYLCCSSVPFHIL